VRWRAVKNTICLVSEDTEMLGVTDFENGFKIVRVRGIVGQAAAPTAKFKALGLQVGTLQLSVGTLVI
jgi:hypothetical protein